MTKIRRIVLLSGVAGLILSSEAQAQDPKKSEQTGSIWTSAWNFASHTASLGGLFVKSLFCDIEVKGEGIRRPILNEKGEIHAYEVVHTAPAMIPVREIVELGKGVFSYATTTPARKVAADTGQAVVRFKDSIKNNPWQAAGHGLLLTGYALDGTSYDVVGAVAGFMGTKIQRAQSIHSYAMIPAGLLLASAIQNDQISEQNAKYIVKGATVLWILGEALVEAGGVPLPSFGEYQTKYSGSPCSSNNINHVFSTRNKELDISLGLNVNDCLRKGNELNVCRNHITQELLSKKGVSATLVAFARHSPPPSSPIGTPDAISQIIFDGDHMGVCYRTAFDETNPHVITTCFPHFGSREHTVKVENVAISHYLKGLKQGKIAPVVELVGDDGKACAEHRIQQDLKPIDVSQDLCTLFATEKDGRVTQLCFNTEHPEFHVLREAEPEVSRIFHEEMKKYDYDWKEPASFISDPSKEFGSTCPLPSGSYPDTCHVETEPYSSTDPRAPALCKLTAFCTKGDSNTPPVKNVIIYGYGHPTMENEGGKLTFSNHASKLFECDASKGSHIKTCNTTVGSYESPDPNLKKTPMCLVNSTCFDTDRLPVEETRVYYAPALKKTIRENCGGVTVDHAGKHFDGMCQGKHRSNIDEVARRQKPKNLGKRLEEEEL